MSGTDSDSTIGSAELEEIISSSKRKQPRQKSHSPDSLSKLSKSPVVLKNFHPISDSEEEDGEKDLFPSDDEVPSEETKQEERPKCKFWDKCYRKNPEHLKMFSHPLKGGKESPKPKKRKTDPPEKSNDLPKKLDVSPKKSNDCPTARANPYGFYLTKVNGIPPRFNQHICYDIKDLLLMDRGTLKASAQFNYMFDIPWLLEQYPPESRNCPLTIVHGEQRESKKALEKSGEKFSNIQFCQAKLNIPFGTHHTKMMFLLYENGLRIVIHTSNIVPSDWFQKTQGMWVSPLFPPLDRASAVQGDSDTGFKADLLEYVNSYGAKGLEEWCNVIKKHDMSTARVFIIGSSPGRHIGSQKTSFGHLKLRKVLTSKGPPSDKVKSDWYVVGQFSSIGSLGTAPVMWLTSEFLTSLSAVKTNTPASSSPSLKLVYPCVENVRRSLEGYPAGASLPYSIKVATKQPYLNTFLHQWKSERLGRSEASPHIKTYLRVSPDHKKIAWFLVTSANLSKAAWGSLEKQGTQFMIRSYELGVLFLPEFFGKSSFFTVPEALAGSDSFPVPYDVPLTEYGSKDQPWIWDIPHVYGPDRFGNKWCPP